MTTETKKIKHWLITSGGTKVPIDKVRDITNMSSGTFGSKLAKVALDAGDRVTFLYAKHSKHPFLWTTDVRCLAKIGHHSLHEMEEWGARNADRFKEVPYVTFDDYKSELSDLLYRNVYDGLILAAAVSDYGVTPVDGKIRSTADLTLNLFPYPKIISSIKENNPDLFLVGFKLLVDSTPEQLYEAVESSFDKNGCDMVVGNDLTEIRQGKHRLSIFRKTDKDTIRWQVLTEDKWNPYDLASGLFREINDAHDQRK